MKIETLVDPNMGENTYIVYENENGLIIDPGLDLDTMVKTIDGLGIKNVTLFVTHGHFDHIYSLERLAKHYGVPINIYKEELPYLYDTILNASALVGSPFTIDKTIQINELTDSLSFNGKEYPIYHTPGHSLGHVVLLIKEINALITGDLLFASSIGRTDLKGCSPEDMEKSLAYIKTFDPKLKIYPGHGPVSTIGDEIKHNPHLKGL